MTDDRIDFIDFVFLHAFGLVAVPSFAPGQSGNDRGEAAGFALCELHAALLDAVPKLARAAAMLPPAPSKPAPSLPDIAAAMACLIAALDASR